MPRGSARISPTMTDVARLAGVSQSCVSLVLNDAPGARVPESTRLRVIRAARKLGYELPGPRRQCRRRNRIRSRRARLSALSWMRCRSALIRCVISTGRETARGRTSG